MRIAYFDCFSGISGDMTLGALVDAGADFTALEAQLRRLPLSGWGISAEKVKRKGLAATKINVASDEHHPHRGLHDILHIIEQAHLAPRVAARAKAIFQALGESEARMHNVPVEKVHFHEVGAVDAIVDIVGAAIGFELLGIDGFASSAVNVGSGTVKASHGVMPVPAPATADLLRAAPTYSSGVERELATPTGAAILVGSGARFGPQPRMKASAIGYGAGTAELKEQPNVLRILIGDALEAEQGIGESETVTVLETNVDDMNPQLYGYLVDRALATGALEIFSTPVQMKKNRPGQLITILCDPSVADSLCEILFRETTTIGIRSYETRRRTLPRETVTVQTRFNGDVRMKISRLDGEVVNAQPEFEDCRKLAEAAGVPLRTVIADALHAYQHLAKKKS
jgi:hypothetical protein